MDIFDVFGLHKMVAAIMYAQTLGIVTGKPLMEAMNHFVLQIGRIISAVKTTAWGGKNGHLPLVVNNTEYKGITLEGGGTTNQMLKHAAGSTMLKPEATPHDIFVAQEIYATSNNS